MTTTYRTCPRSGLQFERQAENLMKANAFVAVVWLLVGGLLAIGAVTASTITLLRPAPAEQAGAGIPLIVERGPWRAMASAAAIVSRTVYERMQAAARRMEGQAERMGSYFKAGGTFLDGAGSLFGKYR